MKLFVRSLTGEALDWYTSQSPQKWRNWGTMAQDFVDRFKFNTDTVLDRFYLMKLEKKSTETFREYAMKWRAEAAKVQPPIEESEMITLFVQSLKDATYYERMISVIGRSFSEVIRMRDFIEEGIRTGRITNFVALQATSETIQSDSFEGAVKRKRDGVSSVVTVQKHRPNQMSTYQMPSPQPPYYNQNNQSPHPSYYYPDTQSPQPYYQYPHGPYPVYHTHPIYSLPRAPVYPNPPQYQPAYLPHPQVHTPNAPRPRAKYERKPAKTYTPLAEPRAQLYERLKTAGILQPIPGNVPNPVPKWHDETKHCVYHSGIPGHDTENCYALRNKIETLIKEGVIQLKGPSFNVNDNPLPDQDNTNVNMITVDEEHNLEGTIVPV
ncbi:hypothetical protein K7X08_026845 [Anisodus acutangulus]|uniref:Retrotransposon gag domain-containing protein n=1 Tax=Anisodus acutangulus TaxID=402998 RepID=A0A9Q1LBN9_9SOLA|nr:hypothetical protein K7X08_026845 [Anisodus acutangulus]